MNDDFATLYAFNRWADRRVLDACRKLTPEQYVAEPVPGWSSVRSSIHHIAVVTEVWLRMVAGETVEKVATEADVPTVDDADRLLDRAHRDHQQRLAHPDGGTARHTADVPGRGRVAVLPPWIVLRHVVNHSSYHRGQVASKLKRLGVEPPAIDLVFWAIEQIPQQA